MKRYIENKIEKMNLIKNSRYNEPKEFMFKNKKIMPGISVTFQSPKYTFEIYGNEFFTKKIPPLLEEINRNRFGRKIIAGIAKTGLITNIVYEGNQAGIGAGYLSDDCKLSDMGCWGKQDPLEWLINFNLLGTPCNLTFERIRTRNKNRFYKAQGQLVFILAHELYHLWYRADKASAVSGINTDNIDSTVKRSPIGEKEMYAVRDLEVIDLHARPMKYAY